MRINKLTVNGKETGAVATPGSGYPLLSFQKQVQITGLLRGDVSTTTLQLTDDHLLELVYEDGTTWLCSPDTLEELYPGMITRQEDGKEVFRLPDRVEKATQVRGLFEKIALKFVNLFIREEGKKIVTGVVGQGMDLLAADLEDKQLGGVRGLVRIGSLFDLNLIQPGEVQVQAGPVLLFIHGTNSSTTGSFAEIRETDLWKYITSTYHPANILGFQHETLRKSPLQNAAELIGALPQDAELHLITHSRGGLVGEVLARCGDAVGTQNCFSEKEIESLTQEGRVGDIGWIGKIQEACLQRRFRVTRFIRVACPANGTTLVAKRLDHFFNISLNLIGLATGASASPVYTAMKALVAAVIDQKNDANVLPGLEAMRPESPFIKVLNNQETKIRRPVVAISGNCKTKVNFKALLIIAEKLFFGGDNDLVVNTQSMYEGSQRAYKLQYFFDEGTDVDHFHYFSNDRTNKAILYALQAPGDTRLDGFAEYFRGSAVGPSAEVAQTRNALLHLEGGQYSTVEPSGLRPIAVILPGIMGSCLTKDHDNIWVNYFRMLSGGLAQLAINTTETIRAPAIIETSYQQLGNSLSSDYDVVAFPFDWRKSPQEAAALLEERLRKFLSYNQPIKLLAHSLGGVVVRDLMIQFPETWKALNAANGFRLIFLGTPLKGSYRIVNVLLGEDDIINKLSKLDLLHTKKQLLEVFNKFPGILALLPLSREPHDNIASIDLWRTLTTALGDGEWPLPNKDDLTAFGTYRTTVLDNMKDLNLSNAVYIAGHDSQTPCGYRIDERQGKPELVLLSTGEGDQSVTWDSAIPQKMIDDNTVYYVEHSHGALVNSRDMFAGLRELMERGKTDLFSTARPAVRGEEKVFKRPEVADLDLSEQGLLRTLFGVAEPKAPAPSELPVKVNVSHGDVRSARFPVLAGHFKQDGILYGEKRIDQLLAGQLQERYRLGIYPGLIGSCEVVLTYAEEGFQGGLILGLGEPDTLTAFDLARSVEQTVAKYLLIVNGRERMGSDGFKEPIGISSLIIGCGYGGLSIESSVQAIIQGVINANSKIGVTCGWHSRRVTELEFIELYKDRALGCCYAIRRLANEAGGDLRIIPDVDGITGKFGGRSKMNIDQGKDWWTRITIVKKENDQGVIRAMSYSISTGAAREELEDMDTVGGVVEGLIESISTNNHWTEEKARAIFELLIPNSFKSRLKRHGNITWVLDDHTATFPWELLQHKGEGVKPMCINAGMIRQLATSNTRPNIDGVTGDTALVVGDPDLKGFLQQLPQAQREAEEVSKALMTRSFKTTSLIRSEQDEIVTKLMSGSYRIIHLAGHGIYNPDPEKPTGMVIGKDSYITVRQIKQMSDTPELVFVNCCYLGKMDSAAEQYYESRFRLAANIGTQLINNGVKAVVVAGWVVEDNSARLFATTFYENMFLGRAFGEAVRIAREAVYNFRSDFNTWGAYQCYGNPWYRLKDVRESAETARYVVPEQAEIDLRNLESDIKMGDLPEEAALGRLKVISDEIVRSGTQTAVIAELQALIYMSLNKYDLSREKFREMLTFFDGTYSFKAVEQYCSLRTKILKQAQDTGETREVLEAEFDDLIRELDALIRLSPSDERYDLLASTWKRRCSLYAGDVMALENAIRRSADNYRQACRIRESSYPYINWVAMEQLLVITGRQKWGDASLSTLPTVMDKLRWMAEEAARKPAGKDFWALVATPNVRFAIWLLTTGEGDAPGQVNEDVGAIVKGYTDVWKKGGSRDERMAEIEHLELLAAVLKGLQEGHWLIGRILAIAAGLRQNL